MSGVYGFLKACGQKLVNGYGDEILLRGVGLGGWLLPEGYMWQLPDNGDRPRRIEKMLMELVGREKSDLFWETYRKRYISEADIRRIAEEGFNSVRIPMNGRHLIDGGSPLKLNEALLGRMDEVIDWCSKYRIYAILDLHGAPGGQTGTNIDDSENDRPELFENDCNRQITIAIWRMLAERYKDRWIVAGYDLLNEPLPEWFSSYNSEVMPLYRDIIKAIREVDQCHLIILEGVHWATDWSIFDEKPDGNIMLQFHKYWNNPDSESIGPFLAKREEWDIPIFMGEGGENNLEWYTGAFRLFEDHHISWNFWTWKKMDTHNSPCSVVMPANWHILAGYLKGGSRPDEETAEAILWEFLENISFDKCTYHPEVACSLFRRPPVRIPAVFYGYRGEGRSYGIGKKANRTMAFRINDGTDIRLAGEGGNMPNFRQMGGEAWRKEEWMHLCLEAGSWLAYEFTLKPLRQPAFFAVDLCILAPGNKGRVKVLIDGKAAGDTVGGGSTWEVKQVKCQLRPASWLHSIVLEAEAGDVCIKWLEIIPANQILY